MCPGMDPESRAVFFRTLKDRVAFSKDTKIDYYDMMSNT